MMYAVMNDQKCVNVIEADSLSAETVGAIELPEGFWIGDYYYDGAWHHDEPPHEPTTEEKVAALSAENEALTAKCAKLETVAAALADQQSFYEDCIAEMAEVVYA